MKEEMEVDYAGFENQRKDEMINSGAYARVEIVVGENYKQPFTCVQCNGIGPMELTTLIACLEETRDKLLQKEPMLEPMVKVIRACMRSETIDISKEEE